MLLFVPILANTVGLSALLQPIRLPSTTVWSVGRNGCGSPFVTSTDGTNNMIVWVVGTGERPPATSDYTVTTEILALLFMPVAAPTN